MPETEPSKAPGVVADTEIRGFGPDDNRSSDMSAQVEQDMGEQAANALDAIAVGTLEGLKLTLNVAAMLIAFLALIALLNGLLGWFGGLFNQEWSLSATLSWIFSPLAWLMGIAWQDCSKAGELLGVKMVANEFVAYAQFSEWLKPGSGVAFDARSTVILTYALCGFANFGSIGIQIGGIGGMAPSAAANWPNSGCAMVGGTLANFMTACVAGILI